MQVSQHTQKFKCKILIAVVFSYAIVASVYFCSVLATWLAVHLKLAWPAKWTRRRVEKYIGLDCVCAADEVSIWVRFCP